MAYTSITRKIKVDEKIAKRILKLSKEPIDIEKFNHSDEKNDHNKGTH